MNGEKEEGDTGGWEECKKKCVQREGGMRWAGTRAGTWLQGGSRWRLLVRSTLWELAQSVN